MTQATSCIGRLLRRIELGEEVLKGQIAPGQPQFLELVLLRSQATKNFFMIIVGLRHLWHAFVVVFKPLILETLILGAITNLLLHEKL